MNSKNPLQILGRPGHAASDETRALARTYSRRGLPQAQIAADLGISEKTLRLHYRVELNQGMKEANLEVLDTLFQMATKDRNPAAAIFWAKTRCSFRQTGPLHTEVVAVEEDKAETAEATPMDSAPFDVEPNDKGPREDF